MTTQFLRGVLEQVIWKVKATGNNNMVHHSDHETQYQSIKYAECLVDAEIDLSVGTVGDTCDNALAANVIGLFKTAGINQTGPWKSMRVV